MSQRGPSPEETADEEEHPQRRREWMGIFRSVILPIVAVAAIAVGVWQFEGQSGDSSASPGGADLGVIELPKEKNATDESPAPRAGRAAPDFRLTTLDGGTIRLSDLQGKPVVVNFWATWCGPCRKEFPEFIQAADEFKEQGLTIIGVNVQEPRDKVAAFVDEFGANFTIALDTNGQVVNAYRVTGLPTTIFIDRQGVVKSVYLGQLSRDVLLERLRAIF